MILRLYVKLWYNVVIVWRETVSHDERSSSSSEIAWRVFSPRCHFKNERKYDV